MVRHSVTTRVLLASIVVVSIGIGLIWMLLVPFFQEPDENSHFDYAYQLYSVGRPYHVKDPTCARDVTPAVRYLERASDFYGLRFIADARVPKGYGNRGYFRTVDASAPAPANGVPLPGSDTPCVMFTYPAGFYAIVAGVIGLADRASGGSLVSELYAARSIGIACLALTLPLCYRLLRDSGVTARNALIGTAAIGIFPLTSWVSAYVQPDNLTFTGVTLALLAALRLKSRPCDTFASVALGVVLSLLAFVKQPYAGVVYLTSAALVLSGIRHARSLPRRFIAVAFVCVIPLLALRMATFATPVGSIRVAHNLAPTAALPAAATTFGAAGQIVVEAWRALGDAYVSGISFRRFWDSFGWTDVSYFHNVRFAFVIETVIGSLSCVVLLSFLARQWRVCRRIVRVALRRSAARALELACGDVVLNTYVLWTALLIVVCAASRGTWTLQGRYWLPVLAPMMVILVGRAPRALPIYIRSRAATLAACAMLGYSVASAPFALTAAYARYYRPTYALPRVTVVAVDGMGFFGQRGEVARTIAVRSGGFARVRGLAFHATDGSPIERVDLQVDAEPPIATHYGFAVPTAIAPMRVGYEGLIRIRNLAPGRHRLSVLAYTDGRHFDRWSDQIVLDVMMPLHP